MAKVYYKLIVAGRKTLDDVPEKYYDAVKALLIEAGYMSEDE